MSSFDDTLDALGHVHRRNLLVSLLEHNPQDELPEVIADADRDRDAVDRLVSMNHVHLPKLEEYGFIEWERESHEVRKGPKFGEIRPVLELLADHEEELPDGWL
jgi:predicted transcriptional regulator